jgi:hypothetical protein
LGGVAVFPCPHRKNTGYMPSNAWNSPRKPKTSPKTSMSNLALIELAEKFKKQAEKKETGE